MKSFTLRQFALPFVALSFLTLQAGSPAEKIDQSLPEGWQLNASMVRQYSPQLPSDDHWWTTFDDPILTSLIADGERNNFNLAAALQRIESARQTLRQARAAYYPTIGAKAGWNRERTSGRVSSVASPQVTESMFDLGLTASWEVDLFGRVRAQSNAAKAQINYAKADYDAAMIAMASQIASTYFELRMYQAEYDVALKHIASQQHVDSMTMARFDAGLGSMLDVTQAHIVLYSTQASVPSLESMIDAAITSIATLTGRYYSDVSEQLSTPAPLPSYYHLVQTGIPADLLRRRPDIIEAEAQIAQYAAQLGVAKKEWLPSLTLNGSIGTQAHKGGDLFKSGSYYYEVAPQLTWTIFDGFSRSAGIASARAEMEAAIDSYNMTVLTAVNETRNYLQTYSTTLRTIGLQEQVLEQSRRSLELAVDMYRQGLTPFSNVVDAQMSYLENQNSYIQYQGQALTALVDIYQALGGGWSAQ